MQTPKNPDHQASLNAWRAASGSADTLLTKTIRGLSSNNSPQKIADMLRLPIEVVENHLFQMGQR